MTDTDRVQFVAPDDDYAFRTSWAEILQPHRWVHLPSDDSHRDVWDRPGRNTGNTRACAYSSERGGLYVFTTSTQFKAKTTYSKFEAYAVLNHDGDMQAAAQALNIQGFGVFRERDRYGDQIVRCGKYSYTWPADRKPLAAGDTVLLPAVSSALHKLFGDKPREDVVTDLGTGYSGPLVKVIEIVAHAPTHEPNPDDVGGPPLQ